MIQFHQAQYQPTDRPIEDRIAFKQQTAADPRVLVGVFDGHGGAHAAEYLSKMLLPDIVQAIPPDVSDGIPEKLLAVFEAFDAKLLADFTDRFDNSLKIPIHKLRQKHIAKKLLDADNRAAVDRAKSGTTALVAYLIESTLYLANTGDCCAILGRLVDKSHTVSALQLTRDLNTKDPHERARLSAKSEEFAIVGDRVLGQIAVTRSFGDAFFKLRNTDFTEYVFGNPAMTRKGKISMHETHQHLYAHIISPPYLIPTPEISAHTLTDADSFLVLASDGLLETPGVTKEWMVRTVNEEINAGQINISQSLLDRIRESFRPGDDVSVAIIVFDCLKP